MDHLMNELVGRSIARERERDLTRDISARQAESRRRDGRQRPRPPRPRRGSTPLVARA